MANYTINMIQRLTEIALIELIIFLLLWFWDGFLAFYLTLALTFICAAILVVSLLAEWLEKSKVKRIYFYAMAVSVVVPWIAAAIIFGLDLNISVFE